MELIETDGDNMTPQSKIYERWNDYATQDNVRFTVYKLGKDTADKRQRKQSKCFDFHPMEMEPEDVENMALNEYGGGDYIIRGYEKGEGPLGMTTFSVMEPKGSNRGVTPGQEMVPYQQQNNAQISELSDMLQRILDKDSEKRSDLIELGKVVLPVVLPVLLQAVLNRPDPFDMLVKLKSLEGGKDSPLETLSTLISITNELKRDEGNEDTLNTLIKTVGPSFAKLVENTQVKKPAAKSNPPQIEDKQHAYQEQTVTDPTKDEIAKEAYQSMINNLHLLNNMAASGSAPSSAADLIKANADEESLENLFDFMIDEQWFDHVCEMVPACVIHKEFYMELRDELLDYFEGLVNDPELTSNNNGTIKNQDDGKVDNNAHIPGISNQENSG